MAELHRPVEEEDDLDLPNHQALQEELDEVQNEKPETAADRDFIDDDGVVHEEAPWEDGADDEEDEDLGDDVGQQEIQQSMQAYEDAKKGGAAIDEQLAKIIAKEFIMACERAVKDDMELYRQRKPAVEKLKLVKRMEDLVKNKTIANRLLQDGFLGTLKAWIELMPDGTLPNVKVRSTVLNVLHKLPIHTADPVRLDQLKRSQIGKVVMFLSLVKEESQENRTLADQLVVKWSRPLVARDYTEREHDDMDAQRKEQILQLRRQREQADTRKRKLEADEESAKKLRPGQSGFRYHARVPTNAKMDYVVRPQSRTVPEGQRGGQVGKQYEALLRRMDKAGKGKGGQGSRVSVSGKELD